MAARAQAALFATAGLVGALGVLLPHPDRFNEVGLLAIQCASLTAACALLILGERTPRWVATTGPFGATAMTSLAIVFTGRSTSAYLLFYLWVALYAFYFLSGRQTAVLCLFAIVNYGLVILGSRLLGYTPGGLDANEDIPAFVLMTGTFAVAGVFLVTLRERVGRLIDQLTDAASTDPLTGLLNRRGFQTVIDNELARSERGGRSFSLLMCDCDFFKHLNDQLGHHAGDDALHAIGKLLEENKRRIDVAARVGGEEFALVLPETDQHEAFIVAERLRSRFADGFSDQPVALTLSLGVATYPTHGMTADALLRAADEALYAAKALGRDRTVLYSAEVQGILAVGDGKSPDRGHAHLATVLNLAEALDMRDTGTARHSQTVGRYCELMARELALPDDHVERVRVAGVLHDIGKIGVPDAILRKPGPLTDDEHAQMRKHPEIGARILGGAELDDIRGWILAHHERPDGQGYPSRLVNDEIPIEARVLAVADAYEAMTSDRVYRKAIGAQAARRELERCSGSQFDPEVVRAFLGALKRAGVPPTRSGHS
ncbi:MAG TPA: diguanylate cyclase [Solirubrobacteraceae bacterium]|jgi:diguanylate cyclase (GGDEF)-like protein/putative nucleotidyltransferase with HDIG domain|nr:diguanylate cyclase [Solirubrobacteraceae bacterium]